MDDFLDITTSLHTNSLTLFVGTGFSKYLTNGKAPSWIELIVDCTREIDKDDKLLNQLFNIDSSGNVENSLYDLTICAQILEVEYKKVRRDLRLQVCELVKKSINEETIKKDRLKKLQDFFGTHSNVNIITTNYDTLFSDYIIPGSSRVIIEGSTMPRINVGQNIYHIHGCVTKPESLVLTLNDYYNFQNTNNYFSRKFYTLLQETTVAIIGYSLGDFNLNTILSEVKNSKKESFRKTDIYYIHKQVIPDVVSKFYSITYGIKVIQNKEINEFFRAIETNYEKAKRLIDSVGDLKAVMNDKSKYSDEFLKLRISLPTILVQASSIGIDSTNLSFLKTLVEILEKKKSFTKKNNAWNQYEHLADWLVEVASTVIIMGSIIEKEFCDLAKYSFDNCSKQTFRGYSWYAWKQWNSRWSEMKLENQLMLQELIENNSWGEAFEITDLYKS